MGTFKPLGSVVDSLYQDQETIQEPVVDNTKKGSFIPLGNVKDSNIKIVNKDTRPSRFIPLGTVNDSIDQSDTLPEVEKAKIEQDPIKSREIIDSEIEKLNQKRAKLIKEEVPVTSVGQAMMMPNADKRRKDELNDIEQKISSLRSERMSLTTTKIDPLAEKDSKEIVEGLKFNTTPDNKLVTPISDLLTKYGPKVDRAEKEDLNKTFESIDKDRLKQAEKEQNLDEIYSWKTVKYGTRPRLQNSEIEGIQKIFENATKDPMYYGQGKPGKFDYKSKSKVLQKHLKAYVDVNFPEATPEVKAKKVLAYSKWLVPSMAFGSEGKGSVEGLKMYAADALEKIDDRYNEIAQIRDSLNKMEFGRGENQPIPWQSDNPENAKKEYENFQQYKARIDRKYKLLEQMMLFNKTILKTTEQKRGIRDLGSGLGYNNLRDLASMNIAEMKRMFNVADISKKIEKNEEVSWEEQQILDQYALLNTVNSMGTRGTWSEVGAGLTYMIPYMASYALTGGISNVVEQGAAKGISKLAKSTISEGTRRSLTNATTFYLPNFSRAAKILHKSKFSLGEMANKAVSFTAGSAAQTLALPQYYIKNIAERTIPDMAKELNPEMRDLITTIDKNTGDKLGKAIWKGGMDAFWEISTEKLGTDLLRAAKLPGRTIKSLAGRDISKEIIATKFMELKGYKSVPQMVAHITKEGLGWHGIKEEYLEELASQIGSMATSGEGPASMNEFIHDQVVTFLTVATFGGGMSLMTEGAKFARYGYVGNNVIYYSQKKGEKKEKVYIPGPVHDKLMGIFNDFEYIDGNGLSDLLTEYSNRPDPKENLSEKQISFILDLALQEGEKKHERNTVIKALKKSGIPLKDVYSESLTDEEIKTNQELLSKADSDAIIEKNLLMKDKYPALFTQDLLQRDDTGQLLEPDIEYLTNKRDEINQKITELSKPNEKGEIDSDGLFTLQRNLSDIEDELDTQVEKEDIGFDYLKPSEKNDILMTDLREKKALKGTIEMRNKTSMTITLEDGRQVNAFIGPHEGINETPEGYKKRMTDALNAWQQKKQVSLRLVPKEEWNPNDEAHELFKDLKGTIHKIPYGDKISVEVDGKTIAAVQIHDYNEKQLLESKYQKAKEIFKARTGELIEKGVSNIGGASHIVSMTDGQKVDYLKDIVNSLVTMLNVKTSQAIAWIKEFIAGSELSDKDKNDLNRLVDLNESVIMRHVMSERLAKQGKAKKTVPLDLQTMVFENSEAVALSGGEKVNSNLKTFKPLWTDIAEEHNFPIDDVQRSFYHISKLDISNVRNDDTFRAWLISQRTGDPVTDAVLSRFVSIPWSTAISFFNFYANTKLTKQYGMYYSKRKGMELKLLNPSETYGDFVNKFNSIINFTGAKGLRIKVKDYAAQVNKDFASYLTLTSDQRYALKKKQFESDLNFLSELTGIPSETWRNYFTEQTKETYQLFEVGNKKLKNFKSMENLFREEPLRKSNDGKFMPYRQSNLMVSLLFGMQGQVNKDIQNGVPQDEAFLKAFKRFFIKGEGKVMSNLYKLSTSLKNNDDIGMSGKDVKDDLFSSFIQYSDITNTADNILTSSVNNALVNFYKAKGQPIDIVLLNGIHNLHKNRFKKGTSAINMSMEDLWLSLISLYRDGGNTYLHSLGQFKDKPTIYLIEAPKVTNPTSEQIANLDRIFGLDNFNKTVEYLHDNIYLFNQDIFPEEKDIDGLLRGFVYNYAINTLNSNQIFFGEQTKESYPKGILSLVKRAGSSNSPGYRLNRFTEGGIGKSFRFAVANDKAFLDKIGNQLTKEAFDGMIFMSGDIAKKIQVSMGTIYSKLGDYPILDSVKAVISYKDQQTNLRGLTKPNIVNVDVASQTESPTYIAIREYMKKNKIDILSFSSSSKIIANEKMIQLFNPDGSFNAGAEALHGTHITDMDTNNLYVQQDLRHVITPKSTKMPAPFLANMMSLDNGPAIAGMISEMQRLGIDKLERELSRGDIDVAKKKWLTENVNEHSQPELKRLLEKGLSIDDPTYRKMMQTILTAAISKRALEIPINRVTTQEVPDVDGILNPYTITKDGKHTLLAEVITGVEGAREHNYTYEGKVKEAIQHVKENPEEFADLFDLAGNLMEWEITERNGIIPGEVIILNRVPAHALVSHHVARLKKNLPVNFTMINKKSQLASGSDSDGDQRYNQVFYKKNGKIMLGEPASNVLGYSEEEIANRIMMLVVEDYADPKNFDAIDRPIEKDAYDKTVDRLRSEDKTFKSIDPQAFEQARLNNIVGVLMKGILTDHNTIFSIISRYNMFFKTKKMLTFEVEDVETEGSFITSNIRLDQIAKDTYGAIKAHIGNFQNLAFDNSEDPKIEILGYNEVTANMFTLALIGDNRNSSSFFRSYEEHYEGIKQSIDRQASYFTSPLLKSFISMVRRNNGGMRNEEIKIVFDKLKVSAKTGQWSENDVKNLKTLYYAANELSDFGQLYSYTQVAPKTYAEYLLAEDLVNRVKRNEMKILDTKSLFVMENGNQQWVTELRVIDKIMEISRNYIFADVIEETPVGIRVREYVLSEISKLDPKKKKLSKAELESISTALNAVFNIRMLNDKRTFEEVNKEVLDRFPVLKGEYPNNPFFNFLDIIQNEDNPTFRELRVIPEYTQSRIPDNVLKTIREGFSQLPDEVKDLFTLYTLSRFGSSSVTSNGGFYTFLDDKYHIKLSKVASDEFSTWDNDEIAPIDQLHIANWVIKINKNEAIKKLAVAQTDSKIIDINKEATVNTILHRDALEGLNDINDVNQFLAWENQYDAGKTFRTQVRTKYNVPEEKQLSVSGHIIPTINQFRTFRQQQLAIAKKYFPQVENTDEVHDYHGSSIGHAMLSTDPNLSNFIYDRLRQMYPGVEIFTNREAFYEFVRRNSVGMMNVNPEALGHAFKNAVFIDPTSAIQDILFHEHSHIYWDALPANHSVKNKLRQLYISEFGPNVYTASEIDEMIITDIGKAGTDLGNTFLTGNAYDKFLEYLKDFWRAIKSMFGPLSKTDLIKDLSFTIWNNQDNIRPVTTQGNAEIKNLISYNWAEKAINRDRGANSCTIGGVTIHGVNTMIKRKENSKFDIDERLGEKLRKFEAQYLEDTGKYPTPDMLFEESQAIEMDWDDKTKAGTAIHAVAEEVFSGKQSMDPELDRFANTQAKEVLRRSFMKLKKEILAKYPNAKFITEHDIISTEYMVYGIADLIVDIGNNKLIVFDFKTTSTNYLNPDGTKSSYYMRSFGLMKYPLNKLHQSKYTSHVLQLSTYGHILEEQDNKQNPGEKNTIEKLYVIPVLRHLDDDGKIMFAEISNVVVPEPTEDDMDPQPKIFDNLVPINYDKKYVEGLLKDHLAMTQGFSGQHIQLKDALELSGLPKVMQEEILAAYGYISNIHDGDLKDFNYADLESMKGDGLTGILNMLIELEFTREDISSLPFEALLNIAKNGITRTKWEAEKDTHMIDYRVGSNKIKTLNPKRISNTWYHKTFDFEKNDIDHYFHEMGTDNIRVDDEIIQIYQVKGAKKTYETYTHYKVVKINRKQGWVIVADSESGTEEKLEGILAKEGLLKVYEGIPLEERGVTKNNYVPRFIDKEIDLFEKHWNYPLIRTATEGTAEGIAEERDHLHAQKLLWRWFNENQNLKQVRAFVDDLQNVSNLYHSIQSLNAKTAFNLMDFIRETAINHYMASQIRVEHKNGPSTNMPQTLNIYYMLTKPELAFMDFRGMFHHILIASSGWYMPPRMIEARSFGINFIMMGLDNALRRVGEEQFDLRQQINKLLPLVDLADVVRESYGRKVWRMPNVEELKEENIKNLKEGVREKKRAARLLLKLIYEHNYKFNPKYIAIGRTREREGLSGYKSEIPVSKMFPTEQEIAEFHYINPDGSTNKKTIGKRWAGILHELMQPGLYDDIKLETDEVDSTGRKKIRKFGDIKEQFAMESATKDEIELWMGSKFKHIFTHVPFLKNKISNGKLYNYYNKARQVYLTGDENNVMSVERKGRITTLGGRRVRYNTRYMIEAEAKVMESNVFAYFMKRMAAPIDYVTARYNAKTNAAEYLTELTDFLVYKKSKDLGTEFTALTDYITRLTSLSRIAWSPKTNIMNFVIGQTMDIIREPVAWGRGINRLRQHPYRAFAILKRYGLANIVDEARFDELAKAAGLKVSIRGKERLLSYENTIDLGYIMMEWAEKANQAPIFIGLMTEEEFNAYDGKGNIIDERNALTMNRKIMLVDRVKDVHGDYGPSNAAPKWNSNVGKLLLQFKKYWPATLFAEFAPYHRDRQYNIRSGIATTVLLWFKVIKFNFSKNSVQAKKIDNAKKVIQAKIKEGKLDHIFISSMNDYMEELLAARDSGNITMKQLDSNDRRNLTSAAIQMLLFVSTAIAIIAIGGSPDDKNKKIMSEGRKWWWTFLSRYQADIFFYANAQNVSRMIQSPFASLNTVLALGTGTVQLLDWLGVNAETVPKLVKGEGWQFGREESTYQKDTPYLKEGDPKWIKAFTGFMPAGGAVSWLLQQRMNMYNKQDYFKFLKKNGVDSTLTNSLEQYFVDTKSKAQMDSDAKEYDALMNEYMLDMMITNYTPEQFEYYAAAMNYFNEMKQQLSKPQKSIILQQFKNQLMQESPDRLNEVHKNAMRAKDIIEKNKHKSFGKKKQLFENAYQEINK